VSAPVSGQPDKGQEMERDCSGRIHKQGIPLLVHPAFLRRSGAGQVDLAILKLACGERILKIYEAKSSRYPSGKQVIRLKKSAMILSMLLAVPAQIFLLRRYWHQGSFIYKEHLIH